MAEFCHKPNSRAHTISVVYPVTKMEIYPNGQYLLIRTTPIKLQSKKPPRGNISMFTKRSREKLALTINATEVEFYSMLTLTYPKFYPNSGETVKKDLKAVRERFRALSTNLLWILEFQERGAPHYHLLTDLRGLSPHIRADWGLWWTARIAQSEWFKFQCDPKQYTKMVLRMARFNCHEKVWEVLRDQDQAKRYVMNYVQKARQKTVPLRFRDVGRWWGCSADVRPQAEHVVDVTEEEIRDWLARNNHPASHWDVLPRTLWGVT